MSKPLNPLETEIAISALHSSGNFVVLRRLDLDHDPRFSRRSVEGSRIGLCLDTETTGMDSASDKVIEMGIVAFEYLPTTGEILRLVERYSGFEDPGAPLHEEIIEITGITDDMLTGQSFDDDAINALAARASLVIAHNAGFDRRFVEGRFPAFASIPWACSMTQIDWKRERIGSRTLEFLLYKCCGLTINAHRALEDAEGLLGLLLGRFPTSDAPIFAALLEASGRITSRVSAVNSPFDKKDLLKERGYRWNDGSAGGPKAWWIEVPEELEDEELAFLREQIYPHGNTRSVEIKRLDALSRFSAREV